MQRDTGLRGILGDRLAGLRLLLVLDNLEQVVEELMKEQHKNMLKRLKAGDFDDVIDRLLHGDKPKPEETVSEVSEPVKTDATPEVSAPVEAAEEEIEEAMHLNKQLIGWSTYINGKQLDYYQFKKEINQAVDHVKSAMAAH